MWRSENVLHAFCETFILNTFHNPAQVAETSVARARELELACRELAERDQLVAELQVRAPLEGLEHILNAFANAI